MVYEKEKQVAIAAVTKAAKLCVKVQSDRSGAAIEKPDQSPVTIADLGTQAVICQAISATFSTDAIVGEEDSTLLRQPAMGECLQQVTTIVREILPEATPEAVINWIDRGNGEVGSRYWTLDPIDGTKGFLRNDQYAIALALVEAGEVKLGVLGCPALPIDANQPQGEQGVLFVAVRGQGTTMSCLQGESSRTVHVTTEDTSCLYLTESVESRHGNLPLQRAIARAVGLTNPPLQLDSQVKYGAVARGQAALYLRLPWAHFPDYRENIWDHAAGAIVVEEAGGRVTDMYGKPLDFSSGAKLVNNQGIVASNSTLHEAVLAKLREL
jgi:3'(2'), 5'-bisphosphate nucleotidase